jgi:hypothetical protein
MPEVADAAHAVIREAKQAGIYVSSGGLRNDVERVTVDPDGSLAAGVYPGTKPIGGFTIIEVPSREVALDWARRIATACRCGQELHEIGYDPEV